MANGGVAGFGRWLGQGVRTAFFLAPRWERLRASPAMFVALSGISVLLAALTDRLMVDGPALFSWQALGGNWLAVLLLAWACYAARRGVVAAPTVAQALTLAVAQLLVLTLFSNSYAVWMVRSGRFDSLSDTAQDWVLLLPVLWIAPAQLALLMRCRVRGRAPALGVLAGVAALALAFCALPPAPYWRAPEPAAAAPLQLTQELIEAQAPLLAEQIKALKPQRPGVVDMYTITFAPYAGEDVFRRESGMVAQVMAQRFDAEGRGLQLINHDQTIDQLPWATQTNLRRAILGVAAVMNRDEDVLFIHLTSHGASNGELAASFGPLDVEPMAPEQLKGWLDEAGIKYRVLSISACFAGNWIEPLAADGTLVMTASDADHTSYGCGSKSDLTFFGRAMYDEQLRTATLSFEQAHAASRKIILQRENEAGKTDGYSNPQIKVGAAIRPVLARLEQRLQAAKP